MTLTSPDTASREDSPNPQMIIRGGTVLTMVEGEGPIQDGLVLIRDGRILGIGNQDDNTFIKPDATVLNAQNCIVMPGLINTHCHTAMTLFRGFADDLPLAQWLFEKIFPLEARFINEDTVHWGTLLGCLEMIASGTTCFMDGYFHADSIFEAVLKTGMRAIVSQGVIDFPAPGVPDPKDNLIVGRAFLEKRFGTSKLVRPGLFCHSPATCSEETLRHAREISREYSSPLQIHLSETVGEVEEILRRTGVRPAFYLDSLGILGHGLIAAHCVHLNDDEIALLSDRGVKVVHVPESNMKLASGKARVQDMLDAGLVIGLGTDGCASNNNLDLFQEMDSAAKLAKVASGDPRSLNAPKALATATRGGAGVMGLEQDIGTLEVGKQADIIVVDTDRPHLRPLYNPCSTLVYSARGADVRHVLVQGRLLYEDRCFKTLDAEEIMERVRDISREIKDS